MLTILAYHLSALLPIFLYDVIDFQNVIISILRSMDDLHVVRLQLPHNPHKIVCATQNHVVVT